MGMAGGFSDLQSMPCLQVTLTFLSPNSDTLTHADITTTKLACVHGDP